MKWFKHMTISANDEKLSRLTDMCGLEGYGFWWRLVETVAAHVEKGREPSVSYSITTWCRLMGIQHHKFKKLLAAGAECGLYEVFTGAGGVPQGGGSAPGVPEAYPALTPGLPPGGEGGNPGVRPEYGKGMITVRIPNIVKYRDEYSKKSGQCPERVRSKEQKEKTEGEGEEKKIHSASGWSSPASGWSSPASGGSSSAFGNPSSAGSPAASAGPSAAPDAGCAGSSRDSAHYVTRRNRRLTGKRLAAFERFWAAFGYARGKAEAADAWLDIPELTDALVEAIVAAALREAEARPQLLAAGRAPKWPQGWIAGRRWEDGIADASGVRTLDDLLAEQGIAQ